MPRRAEQEPLPADRASGAEVIDFIESYCFVPEGKHVGKKFKLYPWQEDEICRIYDNPMGTRRAILSFGRKNGKTSLAACLLLAHLCGPPARNHPNSQLFSAAQSRDQASILFALAAKMVRLSPTLSDIVNIRETAKELYCAELGTKYRALSAEATTAYGLSPAFLVHDELGQVRGPRSQLYEALETACSAHDDPLSIIISTQAPTDNDLLSILIDDALAANDPHTLVRLYTAAPELDAFTEDTIRKANPAFGSFLSSKEVLAMAKDAQRMPAREAEYRNLILNQRIEVSSPFIAPQIWRDCSGVAGPIDNTKVYGGLDLSETSDLTALVLMGRVDDIWHVHPTFWIPDEGLAERSISTRVPFDLWRDQGHLLTTPGRSVSYEYVAEFLKRTFDRYKIDKLAFDRWNFKHLKPWLIKAGFGENFVTKHFVEFGQGFASISPAMRDLEQLMLDRKIAHSNHPVLAYCMNNAVVVKDDAGNRKLSKKKSVGRIDGAVALVMAVGVAPMAKAIDLECLIA
jgi:phage terminase large subunit-like protein